MKHSLILILISIGSYVNAQENLIQDANFESADFSKLFYQTYPNVYYDQWTSFVDATLTTNTTISRATDATRNEVAQMTNGATGISNSTAYKAFISQRLQIVAEPTLYKLSFWGRSTVGTPTVRVFVKIAGSATKFFIFDTGKPTTETGTYTAFCKNLPLTTNWQYFENVLDLSKTTTTLGSIVYNTAVDATTEDLTNFGVCLQNNTANSTAQFDEVSFSKVDISTGFSESTNQSDLKYLVVDKDIFVSNISGTVEIMDILGKVVATSSINENGVIRLNKSGLFLLKYKNHILKIRVK